MRDITFDGNHIDKLVSYALADVVITGTLKMDSLSDLVEIEANAFQNTSAHFVYITSGSLETISANAFAGLTVHTLLNLGSNKIATLGANAFSGLSAIGVSLDDQRTPLRSISARAFDNAIVGVGGLHFKNSEITSFEEGAFTGLIAKRLEIGPSHTLTSLTKSALSAAVVEQLQVQGNSALTQLSLEKLHFNQVDISNNGITALGSTAFSRIQVAGEVHIAEPQLTTIEGGAFAGAVIIGSLSFGTANIVQDIQANAFADAVIRGNLKLSHGGRLITIQTRAFAEVEIVGNLELTAAETVNIDANAFENAIVYGTVMLDDNRLTDSTIERFAFRKLTGMQGITLAGNTGMTSLTLHVFEESNFTGTATFPQELVLVEWPLLSDWQLLRTHTIVAPGMASAPCNSAGVSQYEWHETLVCTNCPPGYYCPDGDAGRPSHAAPVECPDGTGMLSFGASAESECKPCSVLPEFHHGGFRNCDVTPIGSESGSGSRSGPRHHSGSGSDDGDDDTGAGVIIVIVVLVIMAGGLAAIYVFRRNRMAPVRSGYRRQSEQMGYELGVSSTRLTYTPPDEEEYATM